MPVGGVASGPGRAVDVSVGSGGGSQRSTLSGRKRSFSPGPSDVSGSRAKTLEPDEGNAVHTLLNSQLGITQIPFENKLDNWVKSAADASEKENRLEAQRRILVAKETNAEALDLSGLNLTDVPPLDALANLKELDLSKNQLSILPDGCLTGLNSLQELDLSTNQLSILPLGCFTGIDSLQRLYLENNQLSILPDGCLTGLNSLQELYLDYNELSPLPDGCFAGLNSLKELSLSNNQLSTLPDGCFTGLTFVKEAISK